MGTYLYGVFYTIVYVVLCIMFVETFEEQRKHSRRNMRLLLAGTGLVILDYIISIVFVGHIVVKVVLIIVCGAFIMWICFNQKYIKTLILILLYQGLCFVADYIIIITISKCFPFLTVDKLSDPMVNVLLGTMSQTLLFFLIMVGRRYIVRKSSDVLTEKEWLRFAIFPIFTIFAILAVLTGFDIPQDDSQKNILICIAFGLLLMNLIVFQLINDILKREMQIREHKLFYEHVKNETGMYRTISENYDKQRKREHEYKNQIAFITALAREKKIDELNGYLSTYSKEILVNMDLIDTNNVIVNAIINSKYQEAREKGIVFVVKVNDLSDLGIKDEDIVLILSNLLNNAIEANQCCEGGVIKLKFIKEKKQIIISVANSIASEPVVVDGDFVTSKSEDSELHGVGICNIKETVKKYGGSCVIKYDVNGFRFVILIPVRE